MKMVRPRRARGGQLALEQDARLGIEPAHRLVQDQQRPVGQQRREDAELLRHALGVAADRPAQRRGIEIELLGQPADHRAAAPAGDRRRATAARNRGPAGGSAAGIFPADRRAAPGCSAGRAARRTDAPSPAVGTTSIRIDLSSVLLPAPFRPTRPEDLALADGERDVRQHVGAARSGCRGLRSQWHRTCSSRPRWRRGAARARPMAGPSGIGAAALRMR